MVADMQDDARSGQKGPAAGLQAEFCWLPEAGSSVVTNT